MFGEVDICPREDTVAKLAELIAKCTVVHVRGTPTSGKTILAGLLRDFYVKKGIPCCLFTGWETTKKSPEERFIDAYALKYGMKLDYLNFYGIENTSVSIIDEAQMSYSDTAFWLSILKTQSGRGLGPRFCLFSSYGSPSTGVPNPNMNATPLNFGPLQRVSLVPSTSPIGLFYTEAEFLDVIVRQSQVPGRSKFSLDDDAQAYIYSITNGHPGAVKGLLDYIYEVFTWWHTV